MGQEVNIESIRVLEEQIAEGKGDVIKLKRARNSLLNISIRVPPEILGAIFSWTLVRPDPALNLDSHFDGFCEGFYNFLLVCHHWFEVASHTPKLWGFWGNTVWEWEKWHRYHRDEPLDLVLSDYGNEIETDGSFDNTLKDKLRDCATRDIVRQVHLWSHDPGLLSTIILSLTPDDEDVQHRSIESFRLENRGTSDVDISIFFARVRLSKLRSLVLSGDLMIPWDRLALQTSLLSTISFDCSYPSSLPPTTPQLLAILVSNPNLRVLSLGDFAVPEEDGDGPVFQVTLPNLKSLSLTGELHDVFRLLERLVFPHPLEFSRLVLSSLTTDSILPVFGSYLRHYFRPNHESQGKLWIKTRSSLPRLLFRVETEEDADNDSPFRAEFEVTPEVIPPGDLRSLSHDLIALAPQGCIYGLNTDLPIRRLEDLLVAMPNVETLQLCNAALSEGFLQPNPIGPYSKARLLRSLRSLHLENVTLINRDWGPLVRYLARQVSESGGKAIRLTMIGRVPHLCPDVEREIRDLVQEFNYCPNLRKKCPTGRCGIGMERSVEGH